MTVFGELRKLDKEFIGRGFVLNLIADFAQRSDDDIEIKNDASYTLDWLLRSLCEREMLRQNLPLSADEQLKVFRAMAVEAVRSGRRLETNLVELAVYEIQPTLENDKLKDVVDKLKQHPLVRWLPSDRSWTWQEEQIEVMLLADYFCQSLLDEGQDLTRFWESVKFTPSRRNDIAAAVVGVALTGRKMSDEELARAVRVLVNTTTVRHGPCRSQEGCALGVAIALRAIEKAVPKGRPRDERRRKLEYYFGENPFQGLFVTGTISAMDFAGVSFRQCYFDQAVWVGCRCDATTKFENCHFVGGDAFNCQGFGLAAFENTALDPTARAWITAVQVRDGKKKYSQEDLDSDMRTVLDKFAGRGGLGLRTVEGRNLTRGPIQMSPHRDAILQEIVNCVLQEHTISAKASTGYNVSEGATQAMRFYVDNNVFTGPIAVAHKRLLRRLGL